MSISKPSPFCTLCIHHHNPNVFEVSNKESREKMRCLPHQRKPVDVHIVHWQLVGSKRLVCSQEAELEWRDDKIPSRHVFTSWLSIVNFCIFRLFIFKRVHTHTHTHTHIQRYYVVRTFEIQRWLASAPPPSKLKHRSIINKNDSCLFDKPEKQWFKFVDMTNFPQGYKSNIQHFNA